jgi:hypothetical protein
MQQPAPGPARRQVPAAGSYSGLAIATLVVGVMTVPMNVLTSATALPFFLLTAIPTILMGHKAVEGIERNAQKGKIIARIGMFFAYASILFGILGYSIMGYHRFVKNERWDKWNRRWVPAEQVASSRGSTSSRTTTPSSTGSKPSSTAPAASVKPADPKVTTDPLKAEIPDKPVSGMVGGQEFKFDGSVYNTTLRTLDFRQGRGANPEASVTLYLFTPAGETLDGKTLVYPAADARSIHIYVKGQGATKPTTELRNYALRLEFGKTANKRLPGKIYLELPESAGTKIAGTFEAYIR